MSEYQDLGWREDEYLAASPGVRAAIERGIIRDGYHHYMLMGQFGDDPFRGSGSDPSPTTRRCFDPWFNAEFNVEGNLKPCCIYSHCLTLGADNEVDQARDATLFRELRHRLLTGDLGADCLRCHIRESVPTRQFIAELYPRLGDGAHLLASGPLETVRIDVTQQCNLRCVYCAQSAAWAKPGSSMSEEAMSRIGRFISIADRLTDVSVNGFGETTQHPHWQEFCERLIDDGAPLSITTNFGRRYNTHEIDTLSRFRVIQVSLDMVDEDLLRRIRRKVDLGIILTNMTKVRIQSLLAGRRPPVFTFSCGLYDKSITRLESLAGLAVTVGVRSITFWDLVQYPDIPGAEAVRPLSDLSENELRLGLACFDRAMAILGKARINTTVAGSFIDRLRAGCACENVHPT